MSIDLAVRLRPQRTALLAAFDATVWFSAVLVYTWIRGSSNGIAWDAALVAAVVGAGLHLLVGWTVRLHHGRAALGTFEEMILLGTVTASVGAAISLGNILAGSQLPRGVPIAATFIALVAMAWGRAAYRQSKQRPDASLGDSKPAVVVGAGEGGRQLVASMLTTPGSEWRPVALLDDDPLKRHLRIRGVPVMGTTVDMARVAERTGAGTVIIAIPSPAARSSGRSSRPPGRRGWTSRRCRAPTSC